MAQNGANKRPVTQGKSRRKIQLLPDGTSTGKASVYGSAQNHDAAEVAGYSVHLLQTIHWLHIQDADEQSAFVEASPATPVSRLLHASYT